MKGKGLTQRELSVMYRQKGGSGDKEAQMTVFASLIIGNEQGEEYNEAREQVINIVRNVWDEPVDAIVETVHQAFYGGDEDVA
jgi:hypothetical protein